MDTDSAANRGSTMPTSTGSWAEAGRLAASWANSATGSVASRPSATGGQTPATSTTEAPRSWARGCGAAPARARLLAVAVQAERRSPLGHAEQHRDARAVVDIVTRGALDIPVEDGKLRAVIDRSYSLSEVAEAMAYLGTGRAQGKIVITI